MAASIKTVRDRDQLRLRREPHWLSIRRGYFVGFQRMAAGTEGVWKARRRDVGEGIDLRKSLGPLDHLPPNERYDAAVRAAEDWFRHLDGGGSNDVLTVREACEAYVEHLRSDGREATAKDAEARFKRHVITDSKFAGRQLLKLTKVHVGEWRKGLRTKAAIPQDKRKEATKPRSDSSLNRDMTALRAALNHALEQGHVTSDGAWRTALRSVENADGRRMTYLDGEQRRKLVAAAPADLAAFLRGLSMLPIRPGALAALTAGDYDKRLAQLTIGKDKSGRARWIKLPDATAAFFAAQCKGKLPAAPLFARADGAAWNKDSWKAPFKEAAMAAGLPADATAYALRHATITDLLNAGLSTLIVAKLADTSLPMIEKHYGHLVQGEAQKALAKLAL